MRWEKKKDGFDWAGCDGHVCQRMHMWLCACVCVVWIGWG